MQSMVFIHKLLIDPIVDGRQFDTEVKKKERFLKYDGDINGEFNLFVVWHVFRPTEGDSKSYYIIDKYPLSCKDGRVESDFYDPKSGDEKYYEQDDDFVLQVLKKKNFVYREIEPLAHYTKKETLIEHILPKNRLLLNELHKTNDPVESKKSLSKYTKVHMADFILDMPGAQRESWELKNGYEKLVHSISFSRDARTKKAYFLPAMWAHYGQNHKGVCLVFDKKVLRKLFERSFGNKKAKPSIMAYRGVDFSELKKERDESPEQFFLKHAKKLFFKKDSDWRAESEYRFVVVNPTKEADDGKCYLENMDQALVAIVVGLDFDANYLPSIEKLLAGLPNKNIELCRSDFKKGKFEKNPQYSLLDYYVVED